MASFFGVQHGTPGNRRPVRRTRTWTDNGGRHLEKEYSWGGSNFMFTSTTQSGASFFPNTGTQRSLGGRVLGSLFNMLAPNVQQQTEMNYGGRQRRRATVDQTPYGNAGNAAQQSRDRTRSTTFSEASTRRAHGQSSSRHRAGSHRYSRQGPSPTTDSMANGRRVFFEDHTSSDESDLLDTDSSLSDSARNRKDSMEALENEATFHRREARRTRRQLEQVLRQPGVNHVYLQNLEREAARHEDAEDEALDALKRVRKDAVRVQREQRRSRRQPPRTQDSVFDDFDEDPFFNDPVFNDPVFNAFHSFHQYLRPGQRSSLPNRGASANAQYGSGHLGADFEQMRQFFFGMPGGSFGFGAQGARPGPFPRSDAQFQQQPAFAAFQPQPRPPPSTLLKVEECQRLFALYNERWNSVAATDPNIPYPARGLKAVNLSKRNSIWAPAITTAIETWSEETVLKANVQAFFLGAVGLKPAYAELPGAKIELGIDKASGSLAQIQALIDILKKERVRWHSDRLGKRNGGGFGPNEALQNDERARAVYHGVCELIEAAL